MKGVLTVSGRLWMRIATGIGVIALMAGCGSPAASPAQPEGEVRERAEAPADGPGSDDSVRSAIMAHLEHQPQEVWQEWLEADYGFSFEMPSEGVGVACAGAWSAADDLLLSTCHWGKAANDVAGHALVWRHQGEWQVQAYPAPPPEAAVVSLAGGKTSALRPGVACTEPCTSGFWQVQVAGAEALVVVNLLQVSTAPTTEVHLLRLKEDHWDLVWYPNGAWPYSHTTVELSGMTLDAFTTHSSSWWRQDEYTPLFGESNAGPHRFFRQTWIRRGDTYVPGAEAEIPGPYSALVHFVHDLGQGAPESPWALSPEVVTQARNAGLVPERGQHFQARNEDESSFWVWRGSDDRQGWHVQVQLKDDGWRVSGVHVSGE